MQRTEACQGVACRSVPLHAPTYHISLISICKGLDRDEMEKKKRNSNHIESPIVCLQPIQVPAEIGLQVCLDTSSWPVRVNSDFVRLVYLLLMWPKPFIK